MAKKKVDPDRVKKDVQPNKSGVYTLGNISNILFNVGYPNKYLKIDNEIIIAEEDIPVTIRFRQELSSIVFQIGHLIIEDGTFTPYGYTLVCETLEDLEYVCHIAKLARRVPKTSNDIDKLNIQIKEAGCNHKPVTWIDLH